MCHKFIIKVPETKNKELTAAALIDLWGKFLLNPGMSKNKLGSGQINQITPCPIVKHVLAPRNDFGMPFYFLVNVPKAPVCLKVFL